MVYLLWANRGVLGHIVGCVLPARSVAPRTPFSLPFSQTHRAPAHILSPLAFPLSTITPTDAHTQRPARPAAPARDVRARLPGGHAGERVGQRAHRGVQAVSAHT